MVRKIDIIDFITLKTKKITITIRYDILGWIVGTPEQSVKVSESKRTLALGISQVKR